MARRLVEGRSVGEGSDDSTACFNPDLLANVCHRIRWIAAARGLDLQIDAIADFAQDLLVRR